MDYADVGIVAGSPAGVIPGTQSRSLNGMTFTINSQVTAVNEGASTYKQLRVTVLSGGAALADLATVFSASDGTAASTAMMRVRVADFAINQPLAGATVTVSGGPSPTRTELTDIDGRVTMTGLLPTTPAVPKYSIAGSKSGYTVYPEDVPPNPAVYTSFGPTQVFDTTIRLFKTVSIQVNLVNPDGTPFVAAPYTWVWVESSRGGASVKVTGSSGTISAGSARYRSRSRHPDDVVQRWGLGA